MRDRLWERVNIGNARLYGLEEDLGLHGDQFQVAVSILFVTYLVEPPFLLFVNNLQGDLLGLVLKIRETT